MSAHYHDGVLRELWDETTRTYTAWDQNGVQTSQRAFTTEENAALDARLAAAAVEANRVTLLADASAQVETLLATVGALNEITSRANATINANPAVAIKDLTREVKTVARQTLRLARLVAGRTESSDTGN